MNATLHNRPATQPESYFIRAYSWIKRSRADARARRSLAQVDPRTLRDIGLTRRDIAVLSVAGSVSSNFR